MATINLNLPKEFDKIREKFPEINWNEVIKMIILKKLDELKRFEKLKEKGII